MNAPVVLFVFNRPDHTEAALQSLMRCDLADASKLYVFSDGPRKPEDEAPIEAVRKVVRSRRWCAEVEIVEQERNVGAAKSIIAGITRVCDAHGRIIIIEDDLVLSPNFLLYMNTALDRYADEERVMQIAAHQYLDLPSEDDAVLLPFITSWGWGTWKRAWDKFDPLAKHFETLKANAELRERFNLYGAYNYFRLLEHQMAGLVDAYDIRWYLSVFMNDGLALFPRSSLVYNNGFDGSGTHCGSTGQQTKLNISGTPIVKYPEKIEISEWYGVVTDEMRRTFRPNIWQRVLRKIRRSAWLQ